MINMDVIIINWVCNSITFFAAEIIIDLFALRLKGLEREKEHVKKREREKKKKANPQLKNSNMGRVT